MPASTRPKVPSVMSRWALRHRPLSSLPRACCVLPTALTVHEQPRAPHSMNNNLRRESFICCFFTIYLKITTEPAAPYITLELFALSVVTSVSVAGSNTLTGRGGCWYCWCGIAWCVGRGGTDADAGACACAGAKAGADARGARPSGAAPPLLLAPLYIWTWTPGPGGGPNTPTAAGATAAAAAGGGGAYATGAPYALFKFGVAGLYGT
jgi:hypothetical protein